MYGYVMYGDFSKFMLVRVHIVESLLQFKSLFFLSPFWEQGLGSYWGLRLRAAHSRLRIQSHADETHVQL